ncbi:YjhX family toxin [Paracoccus aminophilus]|uniref:Uncharacterized protein n=1 Tax=Paracoccus aminophilus JCM 7686 TaxID=1367847 RepID=S5Y5D7_PARAH|nr:YjhX family toxin [Paracoccus aminophilus]AGT10930.1 hypothetical protein JCM7686_pAMI4p240 [Paracoccus aminophilus JCM 7686]
MNISKIERRALEMLSFGGRIIVEKAGRTTLVEVSFVSREGWFLDGIGEKEFRALRSKKLILSRNGGDYRITRKGIEALQQARRP